MLLEQGPVDLVPRLKRIAPIDEQGGTLSQDNGNPRGAGKPGQPFESSRAAWRKLRLMLIRQRHQETVEPAPDKFRPQGCESVCDRPLRPLVICVSGSVQTNPQRIP